MASISKRKRRDGSTSFVAQVRLKGYQPVARAFTERLDAKRWANSLERELRNQRGRGEVVPEIATMTLGDLLHRYLEDEETRALKSYADTARQVAYWINDYGNVKLLDFGVLALRAARERLRPGRQAATVNRFLSALRSAWNWGRTTALIPVDRVFPPRIMLPEPKGRTRFLLESELAALMRAAESMPVVRTAIIVSIATGVRQGELLRLTWNDVDFDRETMRILESKNDETRAVHLNAVAAEALRELRRAPVVSSTAVFVNDQGAALNLWELNSRWRKLRAVAGLQNFRWHDLRHSAASLLAQHGATLVEIAHVLGHKSTAVTQRYSHLLAGRPVTGSSGLEKKLREALEANEPES